VKLDAFFEKFDQVADAPDAVAKMRDLVLRLAVQGRLVAQVPDDEPADLLVATIAEDRAALVKMRSFARQRQLAPVEANRCPFALPPGWEWTRLGNLCRVQAGFAFESASFVQGDSGVPMIRIRDITKSHTQVNYVGEYRDEFLVDEGDYLVGMDGNFTVAKWRGPRALLNQRVSRLQWYSVRLEPSFFAVALQHRLLELQGTKAYTTVDHLSSVQIEDAVVPLPPLAEQKRIVAKVDELMALCDRLEAQQQEREARHTALARASLARFADAPTPANLPFLFHPAYAISPADLRKSILTLAVQGRLVPQDRNDETALALLERFASTAKTRRRAADGPDETEASFQIPQSWAWVRLPRVLTKLTDGTHHSPPNNQSGAFMYVTAKNIKTDGVLLDGITYVSKEVHDEIYSRCDPIFGDILYIKDGATTGVATINQIKEPFSMLSSVALLKPSGAILNSYLLWAMRSPFFYAETRGAMKGAAITRVTLSVMAASFLPLPPLAEQHRIVAKVEQLMGLVDELETQLLASRTTAANLLPALVSELTGISCDGKVVVSSASGRERRGGPNKSGHETTQASL
jgi:type I restriction enzyme S subunit